MTELGSDLTVSGRIRASQGSVEGDAVMLGQGNYIPGTMIRLGKGLHLDENGAIAIYEPTTLDLSNAVVVQDGVRQYAHLSGVTIPAEVDGRVPTRVILGGEFEPEPMILTQFNLTDLPVYPEDVIDSATALTSDYTGQTWNLWVDNGSFMIGDAVRVTVQDGGGTVNS